MAGFGKFDFSRFFGFNASGGVTGGGTPVPPPVPSVALPAGATVIYSLYKVEGTSRPAAQVRRTSDNALLDIGYGSDGYLDTATIDTFTGASTSRFVKLYDQTGNGHDATVNILYSPLSRAHFGFPTISLVGSTGIPLPDTVTTSSRSFTALSVLAPYSTNTNIGLMQLGKTAAPRPTMYLAGNNSRISFNDSGQFGDMAALPFQCRPASLSITGNASNVIYSQNGATFSRPALAVATMTGGFVGTIDIAPFGVSADFMFYALYPDPTVNLASIRSAVHPLFGVETGLTYSGTFPGDSIQAGAGTNVGLNLSRQASKLFNRQINITNNAIGGQNASTIYSGRVQAIQHGVRAGQINFLVWEPGSNDLISNVTGANLFANTTVPTVQYALANGYAKVFVCTILPRGTLNATQEVERLAYNQLVRDGAAANNYAVVDFTLDEPFDALPSYAADTNNTTYYNDNIHPSRVGYSVMAARLASVVNAWMPPP